MEKRKGVSPLKNVEKEANELSLLFQEAADASRKFGHGTSQGAKPRTMLRGDRRLKALLGA